mgnify:CR=1 FL=1
MLPRQRQLVGTTRHVDDVIGGLGHLGRLHIGFDLPGPLEKLGSVGGTTQPDQDSAQAITRLGTIRVQPNRLVVATGRQRQSPGHAEHVPQDELATGMEAQGERHVGIVPGHQGWPVASIDQQLAQPNHRLHQFTVGRDR